MGSKLILLLGLLVGIFLTLMCVNENKTALLVKYDQLAKNDATIETIAPANNIIKSEQTLSTTMELSEPRFSYDMDKLTLKLSEKDKNSELEEFILSYCPTGSCTRDLTFDKNIKEAPWQNSAIKIASFLKDREIKNGSISINGNLFDIKGELKNTQEMDELNKLLTAFDPEVFKIQNLTTIAEESIPKTETPDQRLSLKEIEDKISDILKANPIYFEFNSSDITTKSKKTLDKIIEILKGYQDIELSVEGHTDSGGNALYNKQLSQKRAESVKNYLLSHIDTVKTIKAVGYGEERPITPNPREEINRRVEIHLKRGE